MTSPRSPGGGTARPTPVIVPEDDIIFRLAQLLLLLTSVDQLGNSGVSLERLGCYDFLVANPMLVFTDEADPDRTRLLMAGFDGRALSYASLAEVALSDRRGVQHGQVFHPGVHCLLLGWP
jgi:hypothetical protein